MFVHLIRKNLYPIRNIIRLLIAIGTLTTNNTLAVNNEDVDIDNDGLIEIETFSELYQMRFNLAGTGFSNAQGITISAGCPASGCIGYELTQDINFDSNGDGNLSDEAEWNNGEGWQPIGSIDHPFAAVFDGNNHTIRNLYINRATEDYIGLFGVVSKSKIQNLIFDGPLHEIRGNNNVGGLAGAAIYDDYPGSSQIQNIKIEGFIKGIRNVGGLTGLTQGSAPKKILGNQFSGIVQGWTRVGGISGYLESSYLYGTAINDNIIQAHVLGTTESGGIVGAISLDSMSEMEIRNNSITVTIRGAKYLGGLIGKSEHRGYFGLISLSENAVFANNYGKQRYVGGLVGYAFLDQDSNISVSRSFTAGINLGEDFVGGFFGHINAGDGTSASIQYSYSEAQVQGDSYIGGLVGAASTYCRDPVSYTGISLYMVYSRGLVKGHSGVGGITGYIESDGCDDDSIRTYSSYWDVETSQQQSSKGGLGYSSAELKCPTEPGDPCCQTILYENWRDTIWNFGTRNSYPVLLNMQTTP